MKNLTDGHFTEYRGQRILRNRGWLIIGKGQIVMKKQLLATTALVACGMLVTISSVSAAEKLQAKVGGYMEQWFGYTSQDTVASQDLDGFDQKSDAEVHFSGSTTLDNGVSIGINVQLEANTSGDQIDESYLIIKGSFGEINLGSENSVLYKMHVAPPDLGIGLNSGDQSDWVSFDGVGGTTGLFRGPFGGTYVEAGRVNDANRLTYYSPMIEGVQFGASYIPNGTEDSNALVDRSASGNLVDGYALALRYKRSFGPMALAASGGYGTMDNGGNAAADPSAWAFGLTLAGGGFSGGISYAAADDDTSVADMSGVMVSGAYRSGPWGVNLAYYEGQRDGGGTSLGATMKTVHLSGEYALGPGVTLKGTFGRTEVEDDSASGTDNSGTYIVTGLKVSF